ncbi:hypothetical protein KCV06_g10355, partial [Aureobasidium melanogenum]
MITRLTSNSSLSWSYKCLALQALKLGVERHSQIFNTMMRIEEEPTSSCASDYGSDTDDGASGETAYQDSAHILAENLGIIGATIGYIQDNFFDFEVLAAHGIAKDLFLRWTRKYQKDIIQLGCRTSTNGNTLRTLCDPLHRNSPDNLAHFRPEMPDEKPPAKRLLVLFEAAEDARKRALEAYRDLVVVSNYPPHQMLNFGLHNLQRPHLPLDGFFDPKFDDLSIVGHYISNAMSNSDEESAIRYEQNNRSIREEEQLLMNKEFETRVVGLQSPSFNSETKLMSYQLNMGQSRLKIARLKHEQRLIVHQHVSPGCDDRFWTVDSIFDLAPGLPRMDT